MSQPDYDLRALALTAVLVLMATVAAIACTADQLPVTAAVDPVWQSRLVSPTALALAPASATGVSAGTVTAAPTAAAPVATATTSPTTTPSATASLAAAGATPSSTIAAPATVTPASTPTNTAVPPTPTNTPVPPTPTNTPTPTATPTPRPMSLRDDLPAMSLADWPRPAGDNGWGMHFVIDSYPSEEEIDRNIQRMLDMRMKWAVVLYGDEIQLQKLAPRFRDAGIMVVWRKMLRPYEIYYEWGRDIQILKDLGVVPYMQIYNEPSVAQEWPEGQSNEALFLENLVSAAEAVYNAGGYVGLQFVSENWFIDALNLIKQRQGEAVFQRMFFIPHSYGMNHPPSYTEDINAVLSFRIFALIFQEQIGFIPPMIVGEGGWKWGATDDGRYPMVNDDLHRDYYVGLYSWFRTGMLSNGEPLPDYLFAFCPWLIAHKMDDNAFYDSFAGDRVITIEAIKAIPEFTRRFTWE